ncbi:hypothetical protein GALMADRAFT_1345028, partial [Galerina marginata CBS 339.88]
MIVRRDLPQKWSQPCPTNFAINCFEALENGGERNAFNAEHEKSRIQAVGCAEEGSREFELGGLKCCEDRHGCRAGTEYSCARTTTLSVSTTSATDLCTPPALKPRVSVCTTAATDSPAFKHVVHNADTMRRNCDSLSCLVIARIEYHLSQLLPRDLSLSSPPTGRHPEFHRTRVSEEDGLQWDLSLGLVMTRRIEKPAFKLYASAPQPPAADDWPHAVDLKHSSSLSLARKGEPSENSTGSARWPGAVEEQLPHSCTNSVKLWKDLDPGSGIQDIATMRREMDGDDDWIVVVAAASRGGDVCA